MQVWQCDGCGKKSKRHEIYCRCEGDSISQIEIITPEDIPEGKSGDCRIEHTIFDEATNIGTFQRPSFYEGTLVRMFYGGYDVDVQRPR